MDCVEGRRLIEALQLYLESILRFRCNATVIEVHGSKVHYPTEAKEYPTAAVGALRTRVDSESVRPTGAHHPHRKTPHLRAATAPDLCGGRLLRSAEVSGAGKTSLGRVTALFV